MFAFILKDEKFITALMRKSTLCVSLTDYWLFMCIEFVGI